MTGVLQRINMAAAILQQNPWIKDMTNSQFKSVDIDQIRREVGAAETEAGLVVQYQETDFSVTDANGKLCCKISAVLTYYSIDDEEMEHGLEFPRTAVGFDTLDKGWNKAESMLYKNHYKGLYHIGERADDPDGMSAEEYDLLDVFRFITSYDSQGHPERKFHDQIMKIVETAKPIVDKMKAEQEEERRKKLRATKAAQAGGFFDTKKEAKTVLKKIETNTEAAVTKADESELAKKTVEADAKMVEILGFYQNNKDCTIIKDYINQYGPMIDWQPTITIRCYKDLQEVGLI